METKAKLTAEEFFETYPEESRLELIYGEVYEMPAPFADHQAVVGRIFFEVMNFLRENRQAEVFVSPIDVVLSKDIVLQPDIVVVKDRDKIKRRIVGSPDLVIEVVSPSTLKRDLTDKMKIYQDHGVKEYWLVFPLEKTIMVYSLTEKGYELFSYATEKGRVKSKVLEGFELEAEEIFGGL